MVMKNTSLIQVLKDALAREYEKIRVSEAEIFKLKLELLELGVELPIED